MLYTRWAQPRCLLEKCSGGFWPSSIVKLKKQDTGLLKGVRISEFPAVREWKLPKLAGSEPADRFCVLDEGLEPLNPQKWANTEHVVLKLV